MALENKLGLTNDAELAREEERISKKKAILLLQNKLHKIQILSLVNP